MKRKIALLVVVIAIIVVIVLVLFPSPKATVAATTIPGTTMNSGESVIIYRFAVSAERADVKIEQIYLTFNQGVSLTNLCFYDESGSQLSGATYYSSEGKIRYSPGWPAGVGIVIPEGATKIFSLQGNVTGQGALSIKMQELVTEKGSVEGLPSAIITLIIK